MNEVQLVFATLILTQCVLSLWKMKKKNFIKMSIIRYIRDEFLILGSTRIPGSYIYGIEEVDYKNTLWMCCILTERKGSYLFQMFAYFFV